MTSALPPAFREFAYWMHRYRRTWRGTIVISVANPVLFLTAMGAGLGKLVNAHGSAYLHGASYLAFLAPGLLAAAAMQTAAVESGGAVYQSARGQGNYRAAAATPMRPADIFAGHLLFMAFRIAISATAITAVIAVYGAVPVTRALLLVPAALLTGIGFAAPIAAFAVTVRRPARINALFRFVIMPMYMFSGTFFPIDQLPAWLRHIVECTPLWHGVQLCRTLGLGTAGAAGSAVHIAVLGAFAVGGAAAGLHTYRRCLHG